MITPGGNPVCPDCRQWHGVGEKHVCRPCGICGGSLYEVGTPKCYEAHGIRKKDSR